MYVYIYIYRISCRIRVCSQIWSIPSPWQENSEKNDLLESRILIVRSLIICPHRKEKRHCILTTGCRGKPILRKSTSRTFLLLKTLYVCVCVFMCLMFLACFFKNTFLTVFRFGYNFEQVLGTFWEHLGTFWEHVGKCWEMFGKILGTVKEHVWDNWGRWLQTNHIFCVQMKTYFGTRNMF